MTKKLCHITCTYSIVAQTGKYMWIFWRILSCSNSKDFFKIQTCSQEFNPNIPMFFPLILQKTAFLFFF